MTKPRFYASSVSHIILNPLKRPRNLPIFCFLLGALCLPYARGNSSLPSLIPSSVAKSASVAARSLLMKHPDTRALLDQTNSDYIFSKSRTNQGMMTHQIKQIYQGIEVLGVAALVHETPFDASPLVVVRPFDLSVSPELSPTEALSIAQSATPEEKLTIASELKIWPGKQPHQAHLVYWAYPKEQRTLESHHVMVDAHSGQIVAQVPEILGILPKFENHSNQANTVSTPRQVHAQPYESSSSFPKEPYSENWGKHLAKHDVYDASTMPEEDISLRSGAPIRVRLHTLDHVVKGNEIQPSADDAALRAFRFMRKVQHYYYQDHDRDSYDERGRKIRSIVHVGRNYSNAFWHPTYQIMAFGDGDSENYGDFTRSLDVAGHEFTHAVVSEAVGPVIVNYRQLSGLVYQGESGALNEALADLFGVLIEGEFDWIVGQEIFLGDQGQKNGIRNLITPGVRTVRFYDESKGEVINKPYPKNMDEMFPVDGWCGSHNDYCWVHVNSTIIGHFGYQLVQRVGKEKTKDLLYATLNHYLHPLATFTDFRDGMMRACHVRYQDGTCDLLKESFEIVGL